MLARLIYAALALSALGALPDTHAGRGNERAVVRVEAPPAKAGTADAAAQRDGRCAPERPAR